MPVLVVHHAFDADPGVVLAQLQDYGGEPGVDIAGNFDLRQRLAPGSVSAQHLGRKGLARPAPDALVAVVLLQALAQRLGGGLLHLGVHGGADGQPARKELLFPKDTGELAADFVGEIVARRQRITERLEIAVLDRAQRLILFGQIGRLVDIAVLPHLAQDVVPAFGHPLLRGHRIVFARRLRHRGQHRGLVRGKVAERFVEIGLRRSRHTVGVLPEEDLVQIELQDLVLGQGLLQPGRKDDLLDLPFDTARAVQKEVLHHLLGDGRCAAHALPAALHGFDHGGDHAAGVIAVVVVEILVLGADESVLHQLRNVLGRDEEAAFLREFVDDPAFTGIDPADRRGGVLRQIFVAGQVAGIHEEDAAQGQRGKDQPKRRRREDPAQNISDKSEHRGPFRLRPRSIPDAGLRQNLGRSQIPVRAGFRTGQGLAAARSAASSSDQVTSA